LSDIFLFYEEKNGPTMPATSLVESAMAQLTIRHIKISDNYYFQDMEKKLFALSMVVTSLLVGDEITGAVIIFRDASEEKHIDRAKSEFVSFASHQLRTPLSSVNWYTEILLGEDVGKVNDEQRNCLEEIYHASQKMVGLVNTFLNVSRIELGKMAIEPELTDLPEMINNAVAEMAPPIKEKSLTVNKHFNAEVPAVRVDKKLMHVVFHNLISNAIKYSPEGQEINLFLDLHGSNFIFKIADNGYGIPKAEQEKIFGKAFRANNIVDKGIDGHGFGLYIVKSIIKGTGGEIWFESKENCGATFYVTLPLEGMSKRDGKSILD